MIVTSVCMSTHNKPHLLPATLESIFRQRVPFEFEVIVVDDGPKDDEARQTCSGYPVRYHRIDRPHVFRNPCTARNVAYRMARGAVVIAQSDEVLHVTHDAIERLTRDLLPGHFLLANVFCLDWAGAVCGCYTGPGRLAPLFFLGSLYREDLYAVGGNDEDFRICPAAEDRWFADCLIYGRRLKPLYSTSIVGHHQRHEYSTKPENEGPARELLVRKHQAATRGEGPWCAAGGPWPYDGVKAMDVQRLFTDKYERGAFFDPKSGGVDESASGAGSSYSATAAIRRALPGLIKELGIRTFFDMGCGDCNWVSWFWEKQQRGLHVDLGVDLYIGADIVPELIEENTRRYGRQGTQFLHLDLLTSDLPQADLVLCRDCLVHLSHSDVMRALANIKRSGSTWLLTTTFTDRDKNADIKTGSWTPYNLRLPPFSLPEPLRLINEDCREHWPNFTDKSLGLWRIADL